MIRLTKTTTKLQIVLDGASSSVKANAFYYDVRPRAKLDNQEYMGAWATATSDGTTDVDLVAAPAQGVIRNIDSLVVYNGDGSTKKVTIKIDDGGTDSVLVVVSLTTGQNLYYEPNGGGWGVF